MKASGFNYLFCLTKSVGISKFICQNMINVSVKNKSLKSYIKTPEVKTKIHILAVLLTRSF